MEGYYEAAGVPNLDLGVDVWFEVGECHHAVHDNEDQCFIEVLQSICEWSLEWPNIT